MMKAAMVFKHKDEVKFENIDIPRPKPTEVLIKIHACGCCHTDVHCVDGDWPQKSKLPLIVGHEGVGRVVEVTK